MESRRIFFDPSFQRNMLFMGNADPRFRGTRSVMNMEESLKKRSFFSTSEELYDEEYFDEQLPEKKRRLTPEQVGKSQRMKGVYFALESIHNIREANPELWESDKLATTLTTHQGWLLKHL